MTTKDVRVLSISEDLCRNESTSNNADAANVVGAQGAQSTMSMSLQQHTDFAKSLYENREAWEIERTSKMTLAMEPFSNPTVPTMMI